MSNVDSRVVTMKFDNTQFEKGVSTSMGTLQKLKNSLDFGKGGANATKNLNDLASATKRFDMGNVGTTIEGVNGRLVAMGTIGVTALATIASKAIEVGAGMARNLTSAMNDGFSDYELKIGSTQTIMNGTGEGIGTVSKYLKELDMYADETIYSLSDMTSNIGKFTNAGVELPVAVNAMKGVANVAALSGANAGEAARAMYNLGQAIGQGSVKLMDWKSVELANMGTKEFKQQLIDAAVAAGTLTKAGDGTVKTLKGTAVTATNFSTTLSEAWLSSKVLTNTLEDYADKETEIGKRAYKAAKDVKTFSMFMETTKAAAGTGWTDTFEIVLGTLPEATKMWTGLSNVVGKIVGDSAAARNKMLGDWKKGGGRDTMLDGIAEGWKAILSWVTPIREAFREIFPKKTGADLIKLTEAFRDFMIKLQLGGEAGEGLKRTFKGVFAIFSIFKQVIGGLLGYLFGFFDLVGGGTGSIFELTGSIGDLLVKFDAWLKKSDVIGKFFDGLGNIREAVLGPLINVFTQIVTAMGGVAETGLEGALTGIVNLFQLLGPAAEFVGTAISAAIGGLALAFAWLFSKLGPVGEAIASLFGGLDPSAAVAAVGEVRKALGPLEWVVSRIGAAWQKVVDAFTKVKDFLAPVFGVLKEVFGGLGAKLINFVKTLGVEEALALVNTGFFIAFYVQMKNFFKSMSSLTDKAGGTFDSISGVLDQVSNNLKTMQQDVKANIIVKIAAAILLFAAALLVLSKIKPEKIAIGLGAIGTILVGMTKVMGALESDASLSGKKQAQQSLGLMATATAMGVMAAAMLAMAGAVALFGNMDVTTLLKGTSAITTIMGAMTLMTIKLAKSGGGATMLAMATAMGVLAPALVGFAMAIGLFAAMSPETLLKGGFTIVIILNTLVNLMDRMPKEGMIQAAAAILIISVAMNVLAGAMRILGGMSVPEMAKALISLAVALGVMKLAMKGMEKMGPASIGMALLAAAILPLAMGLKILAGVDPWKLVKAVAALAAIFVVFGVAATLLEPVAPVMLLLAGAIALLGVGIMAVGAGMFLFATGLAVLAASGAAGFAVLMVGLTGFLEMIPLLAQQFGLGLIAIAKVIGDAGPPLVESLVKILISLLDAVVQVLPEIADVFIELIKQILRVLVESAPEYMSAAVDLIVAIVRGIANGAPRVITEVANMIVNILAALTNNLPRLVQAGFDMVIGVINGIANAMNDNKNIERLMAATRNLGLAFAKGIINGILDMLGPVGWIIDKVGGGMVSALKDVLDSHSPSRETMKIGGYFMTGIMVGIADNMGLVRESAASVGYNAMDALNESMSGISDALVISPDFNPTITPVLDLSELNRQAGGISGVLGTASIGSVSLGAANSISADQQQAADDLAVDEATRGRGDINFEQNIYAPKSPNPTDVYRNTQGQLAFAKEALNA